MDDRIIIAGIVVAAILVPALAAWLLQRASPRMHPVITALLVVVLLIVLEIAVVGIGVLRAVASISESTPDPVSGPGVFAASLLIHGIVTMMATGVAGFPAALLVAFRTRKQPVED